MTLTGRPKLETLARGTFDVAFVPNLHAAPLGIPYVLTVHDASWMSDASWFSRSMRFWHTVLRPERLVERATAVIVPSDSSALDVAEHLHGDPTKVRNIPHGVSAVFSAAQQATDHGVRGRHHLKGRYALFLATLEPRKNVEAALEAVRLYRERTGDSITLVLGGSWGWNTRALRRDITRGVREGWVRHLDYVRDEERPALYRGAAVFLFPSHTEGFGMPILEAMASGTPVITSPRGALPEVGSDAVLYADPIDPNTIEMALEHVLGSRELSTHYSTRGLARSKAYRWSETARKTLEVLKEAIET